MKRSVNAQDKKNIFRIFLLALGVRHTGKYTSQVFGEHPHKYNMLGLSKMLSDYGVENAGIRVADKAHDLLELESPFVAHTGLHFLVVTGGTPEKVRYFWQANEVEIATEKFIDMWSGVALLADPNENSIEPDYKKHRQTELFQIGQKIIIAAAVAALLLLAFFRNSVYADWGLVSLLVLSLAGVYIGYQFVLKQLDIQGTYGDKICSLFGQSDCSDVLESDAAKLWGMIGWSEIGLGYFISNVLIVLLFPVLAPYLSLINILALPYSFWSVWYQKVKVRQWCPLCLIVLGLFWLIFATDLIFGFIRMPAFRPADLIIVGSLYVIPMFVINLLVPLLGQGRKMEKTTQELNSIKARNEVFEAILKRQERYPVGPDLSRIVWGNPEGKILVTILTNPHYEPCGRMHRRVENVLKENDGSLCVQYVFSSFMEELDFSNKFLVAIYLTRGKADAEPIFAEWFDKGKTQREAFYEKYPVDLRDAQVKAEFDSHQAWKEKTGLRATPTILVDGYKLPDNFTIEDLRYLDSLNLD